MGTMNGSPSIPSSNPGGLHQLRPRSSTPRSSKSYGSYETGESSTAASLRPDSSTGATALAPHLPNNVDETNLNRRSTDRGSANLEMEAHRRRRSHKARPSGGFLLPSTRTEEPSNSTSRIRDDSRRRSQIPVGIRRTNVTADAQSPTHPIPHHKTGLGIDSNDTESTSQHRSSAGWSQSQSLGDERPHSQASKMVSQIPSPRSNVAALDVDSTQIVNMALNLSESRRLAARRNISTPVPPRLAPVPDGPVVGRSLKQHLQQQRRASQTISTRPDSGLVTRNISIPTANSSLPPTFDSEPSVSYHFSSSTLNRAQKAKDHLELMAQYRRLLQFVPPLKQDTLSRPPTASPPASSGSVGSPLNMLTSSQQRALGRPYNPLQYIRNRKIRARERKSIDGEALGFSDVPRVTDWIDATAASSAMSPATNDSSTLPPFPAVNGNYDPSLASDLPRPTSATVKPKRPRIDWIFDPADLLADAYWLEQGDNRHLIEDRHYTKILPGKKETLRPQSRQTEEQGMAVHTTIPPAAIQVDRAHTHSDNEDSRPSRTGTEVSLATTRDRARQKLHGLRSVHHKRDSTHGHHDFPRFRRGSSSDTSDSESDRKRRERSGTVSVSGRDLLEKQMMDMLAKEAEEEKREGKEASNGYFKPIPIVSGTPEWISPVSQKGHSRQESRADLSDGPDKLGQRRVLQASPIASGRASLDVPQHTYRSSLDFDSSRPGSPDSRGGRRLSTYVPPIGMDLSPSGSRPGSPTRNPFSKVKNIFRDRSRERSEQGLSDWDDRTESPIRHAETTHLSEVLDESVPPSERHRSKSPVQRMIPRGTDESQKSHQSVGVARHKTDEQLGLRTILRSGAKLDGMIRGGVSKVSDLIWRKDEGTSSSTSTDESDTEQRRGRIRSSVALSKNVPNRSSREQRRVKHYIDIMPPFKSASESIGKSTSQESETQYLIHPTSRPPSRSPRFDQLKPPRIEIRKASPSASELGNFKSRPPPDFDASDNESRAQDTRKTLKEPQDDVNMPPINDTRQNVRRNSLAPSRASRHWSISDHHAPSQHGPISRREIARLRTLVLCTGIKAMEISRRANESHPLFALDNKSTGLRWTDISRFAEDEHVSLALPQTKLYSITATILSESVKRSIQTFETTAAKFSTETAPSLQQRIDCLHQRIVTDMIEMTRRAVDEADEVSRDVLDSQRLKVKSVVDTMDKMLRRRRRRFRWVRRAGWLAVEWVLVGFMWYVWFVVMIARIVLGIGRGFFGIARWLLWL